MKDEICQVIDRLVDDRFGKLEEDERTWIDVGDIKTKLYAGTHGRGNVRKLGKLVDEAIYLVLVRAVLDDAHQDSKTTDAKGMA